MKPITPIVHEGKTYDQYAVSLNSSPLPRGNKGYTTAVNLVLTPMFEDELGEIQLIPRDAVDDKGVSYIKRFSTSDIRTCGNMPALQAFAQINQTVESFGISQNWCALPINK